MPLPHTPEPIDELRRRFPAALEPWSPDRRARHIFDFEDGVRLIVYVQSCSCCDERWIDASISLVDSADPIAPGESPLTELVKLIYQTAKRLRSLAGFELGAVLGCRLDWGHRGGILHVKFPPPPEIVLVHPEAGTVEEAQ